MVIQLSPSFRWIERFPSFMKRRRYLLISSAVRAPCLCNKKQTCIFTHLEPLNHWCEGYEIKALYLNTSVSCWPVSMRSCCQIQFLELNESQCRVTVMSLWIKQVSSQDFYISLFLTSNTVFIQKSFLLLDSHLFLLFVL